jgi:hypothetical protein
MSSEDGNETLGYIKGKEVVDSLSILLAIKNDSIPWG